MEHASSPLRGEPLPGARRRQVCASAPVAPEATIHACAAVHQSPLKGRDWSAALRMAEKCNSCASLRQLGFLNCRTPTDGIFESCGRRSRNQILPFFSAAVFALFNPEIAVTDPIAGNPIQSSTVGGFEAV